MCTAKTTRFNGMVGTSGLREARRGEEASAAPCVHGTPVFQSRDKDEARKGGLHRGLHEMRGRAEGRRKKKRGRRCARKKLESRNSEGYRREGEYKARYASPAAVMEARVEARGSPTIPSFVPSCSLFLCPSLFENDFFFALREDERR